MTKHILRFRQTDRGIFDDIHSGKKRVETRAATVKYKNIKPGDVVVFVCGEDKLVKTVTKVYRWKSIDEMVKEIPFKKIMPSISSVEAMKKVYSSYPNYDQKIKEFGLLGWELK